MQTDLSRRGFLQAGAAVLSAAVAPSLAWGRAEDTYYGFKLAAQSYTFRNFKLEQALKKIADAGLSHVEFFSGHVPVDSSPDQIKAVLKLCGDYKLTPIAFGVESFSKDHDANKKKFEFGAALGIKSLSADPSPDSFDSLDKLVEEYKIAIAIHPHGPQGGKNRHRWWSAANILEAVKDHNKLIGSCLDTGHLIRMAQLDVNLDPATEIRLMGDRNFGIHLKDHNNKKREDVIFGKDGGVLDVTAVLKALRDVKYQGAIDIEYEAKPEDPSADVKACVEIVKECAKNLT